MAATMEMRSTPTPLWLSDAQATLLGNAESFVTENYCLNHCRHHRPFDPCSACRVFSVRPGGYIACDGYDQEGGGVA